MSRFARRLQRVQENVAAPPAGALKGWFRTASNTGLAAASLTEANLTPYTGSMTITTAVTRKVINCNGNNLFLGSGGSLTECIIRNGSQRSIIVYGTGQAITRCNLELTVPSGSSGEIFGIYAGSFDNGGAWPGTYQKGLQINSLYITGGSIGIWHDGFDATDTATIDELFIHMSNGTGLTHRDGFTRRGGNGPLTIKNSRIWLQNTPSSTGAVFTQNTWNEPPSQSDGIGRITFQDSYFEGNGHPLWIQHGNNYIFTNNRTRPTEYAIATGGMATENVTNITFTDNYIYNPSDTVNYAGNPVTY